MKRRSGRGAVDGVVALPRDQFARRVRQLEVEPPVGEACLHVGDLQTDDLLDLG